MSGPRPGSTRPSKSPLGFGRLRSLYRSAGKVPALSMWDQPERSVETMESLEARILLGGDHPSFELPLTPTSGTLIVLDGVTGEGQEDGIIEGLSGALADDLFRFVAPQDDFVTVWADTINVAGGSDLDSRVEVYNIDGNLVAQGSSQGQLTQGFFRDGWAGFVAEAGETYFVRVLSDVDNQGQGTTGGYTIRVDAISNTDLVVETDPDALPPARFGAGQILGSITLAGDDVVYRVQAGSDSAFNSLATFYAALQNMPMSEFDTRIDIYDAQGRLIKGDSLTGRLQTGFSVVQSQADAEFFVRVRGDRFSPSLATATGAFTLKAEMVATVIEIDPVIRRGEIFDGIADAFDTRIYRFTTQGNGLSFVGAVGAGLVPLPQPAVRLYNSDSTLRGFSDLSGIADLQIQLPTNTEFYVVLESFDSPPGGTYNIFIETNHTFIPTQGVDDHVNRPTGNDSRGNPLEFSPTEGFTNPEQFDFIRRQFQLATPLRFSDPFLYTRTFVDPTGTFDPVVNPISDRSFVQRATGEGRIHTTGDTDLFQFVLPVDMLGNYEGNDDDLGDALYAGGIGSFIVKGINNETGGPVIRDFLGIWDAQDWWPVRAGVDAAVYALETWEFAPDLEFGGTALIIGGEFQFADFQAAPFVAAYAFDPLAGEYVLTPLPFDPGGTVRALKVWDPLEDNELPAQLFIGGDFGMGTYGIPAGGGIADGAYAQLFGPGGGAVFAIEAIDYEDPEMGDENFPALYFAGDGGTIRSIFVDPDIGPFFQNGTPIVVGGAGIVHALKTYMVLDPFGGTDEMVPALAIGGEFNAIGGTPASNLVIRAFDPTAAAGAGAFVLDTAGGGTNGPVLALETWDPDDAGDDFVEFLVVGGDFTQAGGGPMNYIGAFLLGGGWAVLGSALPAGGPAGFNAPVHSLNVFVDQEFGVGVAPFAVNPVIYAGGDFTLADGTPVNRMAGLTFDEFLGVWTWTGLGLGSTDTVHALKNFNDEIPGQWDRDDRPAARLSLVVNGDFLPGVDTFVRIYDSQFRLVYSNNTISPPFPDPSGAIDRSLQGSGFSADALVVDIGDGQESQFFAGEVYYLEISSVGGNGRYAFSLITDALPPGDGADGTFDDVIGQISEPGGSTLVRAEFDRAPEIVLSATGAGDGRNWLALPDAAFQVRQFDITPSGFLVTQYQELGMIERINDYDIYFFRASDNGTTEIRIATQQILDQFVEDIVDLNVFPPALDRRIVEKIIDSPLDARIRVFNNDLQLVADNTYNESFAGVRRMEPFGSLDLDGDTLHGRGDTEIAGRVFSNLDPRVAFQVERGEVYFVVVESGQLQNYLRDPDLVDWRHALGGYELLINSTPNLEFADDHADINPLLIDFFNQDSQFPIDSQGQGQLRGEIRTRAGGVEDNDAFVAFAVGTGTVRITVTADNPAEFRPRVTIFNPDGSQRVAPVSATVSRPAEVEFFANKGERYIIRVDANVGQQGGYTVRVNGAPSVDDFANITQRVDAHEIEILDFLGRGQVTGTINFAGDTDIFKFTTPGFDEVQIDVVSNSFGFDPLVRVFELSEDPSGNTIFLPIAFNDNRAPGTVDARVRFPVSGADRTSNRTGKTYNEYYVVVEGADQQGSRGNYTLTITSTPTDDHADAGQWEFASQLVVQPATGQGQRTGVIEVGNDSDLFTFTAPAGGVALLSAISNEFSTLRPTILVFDSEFNPVINLTTGTSDPVVGPDAPFSAASYRFDVVRGRQYFVLVASDGTGSATTATGAYTLEATTPTADDHANESEFSLASEIVLSSETGAGSRFGTIGTIADTDLFFFESIADGRVGSGAEHTIRLDSTGQSITQVLRIFDAGTNLLATIVDGGAGDLSGQAGIIETTITTTGAPGERFFLLVSIDDSSMFPTGDYSISVEGPIPDVIPQPGDDHANRGQFSQATVIDLDPRTGNAQIVARIDPSADSDLFRINPLAAGRAFVQVITPAGSLLDVDVTVFEQLGGGATPVQIVRDTNGFQGVNAAAEFNINSTGATYYVLVSGLNSATGEYTLRLDTSPETFFLYYPEGFVNDQISEFISISNPSQTESVQYTIRLHYENPSIPDFTLVQNATLAPGSRGGVTVAERGGFVFPGVVVNEPYAIVIESNRQVGATLSHYDFEGAVGEAFTPITSETWAFGRLERSPGRVESFLVFFNPNNHDVVVTLTTRVGGQDVQVQQTVAADSRGGWEIGSLSQLPLGVFGATVTSAPVDGSITNSIGIVAALSHYDLVNGEAFGVLGDPSGGSTFNVVPSFTSGLQVVGQLVLFNPGTTPASVTITSDYITAPLPNVSVNRIINPGQSLVLTASDLSLSADLAAGLTITSTVPISGVSLERQNGDINAIAIQNNAATTWFFGDAFMNSAEAGLQYFETLSLYNPTSESIAVNVRLAFLDGSTINTVRQVGAGSFNNLRLDAFAPLLARDGLSFFSIQVSSALPFIASLTHYDLVLDGGWTNAGAPLGLTNPLSRIIT